MIVKNVKLKPKKDINSWNKVSMGSWGVIGDSQVYCELRVDAQKAMDHIKELSVSTGTKVTITHFLGKVMGRILKDVPDINTVIRFQKPFYRQEASIFFQIAHDKTDLSGHTIKNIDTKSLVDISEELNHSVELIRSGNDMSFKKIKEFWKIIPIWLSGLILTFIGFLSFNLNLNIKILGMPEDTFGSMMITNIGSLGFESAFAPLPPYTRVPLLIALGKVKWYPVCDEDGNVSSKKQVSLCITFDHRIIDGAQGAYVRHLIEKYFYSPELL
jgi:pyruvate dehydrogenase E2 component (dihydrolipoamide acetyltransferase)